MTDDVPRDPLHAVVCADPYPYYASLRREPVHFDATTGLWVVATSRAVRAALLHPALRVRPASQPVPPALHGTPTGDVFALLVRTNDGEFHAKHKPAVKASLDALATVSLEEAARASAVDLSGRVDANRWLREVPAQSMARWIGVPNDDLDTTVQAVLDFVGGIAPGATPRDIERADRAAMHLMSQGERLGLPRPAAANRVALMQQAVDATAALLGNAARRALSQDGEPEDAARWRSLVMRTLVDDPPVHNTRRFAAADLRLEEADIREGDGVLVLLASAVQEERSPSLAFGAAGHACPADALAPRMAASALHAASEAGHLRRLFSNHTGFTPLPNARIPVFA